MSIENRDVGHDSGFQPLDQRIVSAERVAGGIAATFLFVMGGILWLLVAIFLLDGFGWKTAACGIAILSAIIALSLLFWFDPVWKFRSTRWRETDRGFELKQGYVWWHHTFIPRERVQHTDVVQGPILRRYGLATLVINTAGTHNYSISVEGLSLETAEALRSSLLPQRLPRPADPEAASPRPQ